MDECNGIAGLIILTNIIDKLLLVRRPTTAQVAGQRRQLPAKA